ncbi:MAG: sialidase family protein [Phycisphaerales bacterium]
MNVTRCFWMMMPVVLGRFAFSAIAQPTESSAIDPPAGLGAMAPNLSTVDDGVVLTWLEPVEQKQTTGRDDHGRLRALRFARYAGGGWTEPKTIVTRDDFFANWADLPALVQAGDGTLFAHWLQKSAAATYAYDIVVARSTDDGVTWRTLGRLHDDQTHSEHGFVSLVAEANGVRAFWLDGREMVGDGGEGDLLGDAEPGSMTLRTAFVGREIGPSTLIDDRVCECCNTSAVVTEGGAVVVYRDRSTDETRDIYIVRRVGDKWTDPKSLFLDGWQIAGCPVNGPAIAARGSHIVVTWFTGATDSGSVRAVFSTDGGARFSEPIAVDDTWPIGRVAVVLVKPGEAIVSWLDAGEGEGAIALRRVTADGAQGEPLIVAQTSGARTIGFPMLARSGSNLVLVWTQDAEPTRLRAVTISIGEIPKESPTSNN